MSFDVQLHFTIYRDKNQELLKNCTNASSLVPPINAVLQLFLLRKHDGRNFIFPCIVEACQPVPAGNALLSQELAVQEVQ